MDTFRAGLEGKRLPSSKLRLPTTNFRSKRKRPVISGPIGPVKNSRGADFVRSDTLIIVPTIKDCCSDDSSSDKENAQAKKTTRRISASFSTQGSLASPPTVAKSGLTATTSHQSLLTTTPVKPLPTTASFTNFSRKTLANSSSFGVYSSVDTSIQDENVPPLDHKEAAPPSQGMNKSRLPKSRTLTVLSDIKSSISRPLSSKSSTPQRHTLADQSRKTSASSSSSLLSAGTSKLRLARSSLTSMSASRCSSTSTMETPSDPRQITKSQPSAYWSGRFMSLHDRFLSEDYDNEDAFSPNFSPGGSFQPYSMRPDCFAANARPTHLSYSTTTSALTNLAGTKPRKPPNNKDARCLRIFQHLENLCVTREARRSLYAWQQTYARRMNKPNLLPQGGSIENTSLMGRIFSGGNNTSSSVRRSLPVMQEPSGLPVSKKRNPALAARERGKRLSFN
ncbi:hypothetical protein NW752_009253 [Fusarium irregulare]|uniref:Uncharacterized protein n=1 Tax=Fusarium irregulare TaxID=2494466 RepID=A0A9W8PKD7_9HYPO|nr:hypothetical protein NW766_008786 [Fusarium irregulare]KAJ4010075.1 hypothetical protein NW752_009253 [Fusarium irregulare]